MRCLSLAGTLAESGWVCAFACSKETPDTVPALRRSGYAVSGPDDDIAGADLLVVDHYGLDRTYELSARGKVKTIMVIDDLADRVHDCDILVDYSLGRRAEDYNDLVPRGCRVLAGPDYALLRPQFAAQRPAAQERRKARAGNLGRILVFLSGTDPGGTIFKVLHEIDRLPADILIDAVTAQKHATGLSFSPRVKIHRDVQDMAALMREADLSVGAGGTASYERCCLGLPALVVRLAGNQEQNIRELAKTGAAEEIHDLAALASRIMALRESPRILLKMSEAAFAVCDGQGAKRLVSALESAMKTP